MKPLLVEMACLLGIQNEIQAVWYDPYISTENPYLDAKRTGRAKAASHLKGEIPFVLAVHFPVIKLTNT